MTGIITIVGDSIRLGKEIVEALNKKQVNEALNKATENLRLSQAFEAVVKHYKQAAVDAEKKADERLLEIETLKRDLQERDNTIKALLKAEEEEKS